MRPTDLVLSYGDLIRQTGYKTRVLGEFRHLEQESPLEPFLLAHDRTVRQPEASQLDGIPGRWTPRSPGLFYEEFLRLARQREIRVVHAHNLYSGALALSARRVGNYRVILDLHGRVPEEYVNLGKGGALPKAALEWLERWTIAHADHVVVVSTKLREYVQSRYDLSDLRIDVIPCCADGAFRWNRELRHAQREKMGLSDKFVCLHLGSFRDWYDPATILRTFLAIRVHLPNAHLLVATADIAAAGHYLEARLPRDQYTLTTAPHDRVPVLLNASDLGFLLLPQTTNIRVSSPTKFAEYVNCGLPVLISPDVGDFSDVTAASGLGYVLDAGAPEGHVDEDFLRSVACRRDEFAARCVSVGEQLRWEGHRDVWNRIISG